MPKPEQMPSRCCHGFVLPDTLTLEDARLQFRNKLRRLRDPGISSDTREWVVEDLCTLQFLVPITHASASPKLLASMSEGTILALKRGEVVWTCKFFHPVTGRCAIYEHRPSMCRTFPTNDTAGLENGHNALCRRCSSTYCKYHPEKAV